MHLRRRKRRREVSGGREYERLREVGEENS
jgi:hypothetical protein